MKHNRVQRSRFGRIMGVFLMASATSIVAETRQEINSWTFHHESDKLNNVKYTLARSPLPQRGLYDRLRMAIVCKENKLQFTLDANILLASKGRAFEFEYQIDKRTPVTISMRGDGDKRHSYTDENVDIIVQDMLTGQSIFIRAHTMIGAVLTSLISLEGAAQPIQQVLLDCGVTLSSKYAEQSAYSLGDFEHDFKSFSSEQQRQLLIQIKAIIDDMR
ncbi:hypothetical protein [Methyloprofundus sp.]|uniref:hypothetical protein n=1 Tax=Methyloprofundus sp. TaxID=2020875 RepID=UPI003D0BBC02